MLSKTTETLRCITQHSVETWQWLNFCWITPPRPTLPTLSSEGLQCTTLRSEDISRLSRWCWTSSEEIRCCRTDKARESATWQPLHSSLLCSRSLETFQASSPPKTSGLTAREKTSKKRTRSQAKRPQSLELHKKTKFLKWSAEWRNITKSRTRKETQSHRNMTTKWSRNLRPIK